MVGMKSQGLAVSQEAPSLPLPPQAAQLQGHQSPHCIPHTSALLGSTTLSAGGQGPSRVPGFR